MDKNVVEILERAANKYADEVVKRTVGENLSPEKKVVVMTLKRVLADAYFSGAAELWEVLSEAKISE